MPAKRILIPSRRMQRKGKTVQWVSEVYLEILAQRGIVPVIVPIAESTPHILQEYLNDYDGLLLVEGGDVHPQRYSDTWNESDFEELDTLKDEVEFQCFAHAYANKKPILGICRGMHIINVALSGTLYADIHKHTNTEKNHIDYDNYDTLRHEIQIVPNTPLMDWYNTKTLAVNSYHHQGIEQVGEGLQVMAYDNNTVIEAIYTPNYPFMVGLQFHPERMWNEYEGNKRVFAKFINRL
ncbi:MAG: gamma-glutamyl-gamma-aminobutyrate hydrolase family protein [Bacteroidetes bacterium]|nr:gamma-glutamyl-gamma-aminobutyrate hydrolase family protein [Bacteroidota bacterium]